MTTSFAVGSLTTFLQGIARLPGLRIALSIDDAPSTDIVDAWIAQMVHADVLIIHVRFCPEIKVSFPRSVAQTFRHLPTAQIIHQASPPHALRSLTTALRRLSRLHPLLLVIDDIQMIGGEAHQEFASFLMTLCDETLSVLCRGEAILPAVRGVIEPYLLEELDGAALRETIRRERKDDWSSVASRPAVARSIAHPTLPLSPSARSVPVALQMRSAEEPGRPYPGTTNIVGTDGFRSSVTGSSDRGMTAVLAEEETAAGNRASQRHRHIGNQVEAVVLGTFEVRRPDAVPVPISGERIRTVLGVMVIDQMLTTPFSYREFCRLTAGNVDDPEKARKIMNMGVKRLGELLGSTSILRNGETPRLNLDSITVDLLETHRLLQQAIALAHTGAFRQALDLLSAALDRVQGAILFPGLDGDIIEAAREEFGTTLRSALLSIARNLMREEEHGIAEAVLYRGIQALPEDEEIIRLLQGTGS